MDFRSASSLPCTTKTVLSFGRENNLPLGTTGNGTGRSCSYQYFREDAFAVSAKVLKVFLGRILLKANAIVAREH